jgi:hypothetical protein
VAVNDEQERNWKEAFVAYFNAFERFQSQISEQTPLTETEVSNIFFFRSSERIPGYYVKFGHNSFSQYLMKFHYTLSFYLSSQII